MKIFKLTAYNPRTQQMLTEDFSSFSELSAKKSLLQSQGYSVGSFCDTNNTTEPYPSKEDKYEDYFNF